MAHLDELGAWVAGLSAGDVPARVLGAARVQVLDMVAAVHAASRSHEIEPVLAGVRAFGPKDGTATILSTGERTAPAEAALANAACSMAQDFDDIVWMGHTCHSAVFAPLAVAEHERLSTPRFLLAVVAANEIGGRLGASSFLGPLNGQMWTFIHLAGAAAATAKLLELDAEKTTHALAIALAQPNFALQPGFLAPTSKLLAAATPTATGIQAAYFARAGMTGHPGLLEDRRGFWRRFSFLPMPFMLGALGSFWTLDTLQIKSYPGCHYFQTALFALERLRARGVPLSLGGVERIVVDTTKLAVEATRFAAAYVDGGADGGNGANGGLSPVGVNFSLAQSAAVMLTAGRLRVEELDRGWLREHDAELRAWLARIEVRHDPELTGRVIASSRRVSEGRRALREIGARDLVRLARRYADEYGSTLFSGADALRALRRIPRAMGRRRHAARERDGEAGGGERFSLAFPGRVTVFLAGGRREVEEVDVPPGSVALPGMEQLLEAKLAAAMGVARARGALDVPMDAGEVSRLVAAMR